MTSFSDRVLLHCIISISILDLSKHRFPSGNWHLRFIIKGTNCILFANKFSDHDPLFPLWVPSAFPTTVREPPCSLIKTSRPPCSGPDHTARVALHYPVLLCTTARLSHHCFLSFSTHSLVGLFSCRCSLLSSSGLVLMKEAVYVAAGRQGFLGIPQTLPYWMTTHWAQGGARITRMGAVCRASNGEGT